MFKHRSTQLEYIDNFSLGGDELIRNLDEIAHINRWLGGYRVVKKALNRLAKQNVFSLNRSLVIADLGCGSGDMLRQVAQWARQRNIKVKLVGVDVNASILAYAKQRSTDYPEISYIQQNIFSPEFREQRFDIILCNLLCHHLEDHSLLKLLKHCTQQVSTAVIINDLHRHYLAYWGIKLLCHLFRGSYLIRHDGPLSVARAFKHHELYDYLTQLQPYQFSIRWQWAFRYQVIITPSY